MRLVPSAKVVKKEGGAIAIGGAGKITGAAGDEDRSDGGGGGGSGLEFGPQTYRGEEDASRTEMPWIKIKGRKKKLEGGNKPIHVEKDVLGAGGEGDGQGCDHDV